MRKPLYLVLSLFSLSPIGATQDNTLKKVLTISALISLGMIGCNLSDKNMDALALFKAIDKKNYKLAMEILDKKPDVNINAKFGHKKTTSLMECCKIGE